MGLLIYWLQIISYIFNVCRVRKILSYAIITTGGSDAATSACMSYSRGDWSLCPAVGTTHPLCVEHARAGEIQPIEVENRRNFRALAGGTAAAAGAAGIRVSQL